MRRAMAVTAMATAAVTGWATVAGATIAPKVWDQAMPKGNTLKAGDLIHTVLVGNRDAHFELRMQTDGNLVFRSYLNDGLDHVCWSTGAKGSGARAVYQNDGNFVVYVGNKAKWASNTAGKSGNSVSIDYSDTWYPGTDLWVGNTRINRGCSVP